MNVLKQVLTERMEESMNAPQHRQLVKDALMYMDNSHDQRALKAIWHLASLMPSQQRLVEDLCREADYVDSYSDLQFYIPFPVKTDYAEYNGRWTTGLNHYINAFLVPNNWGLAPGYTFPWSSQTTMDAEFHSGWIDALNVTIFAL